MIISIIRQQTAKIVAQTLATVILAAAAAQFAIAADGDLDTAFDSDGKTIASFQNAFFTWGTSVAVQQDGKTLIAGTVADEFGNALVGVARYNIDGSIDTGFGIAGLATPGIYSGYLPGVDVALQSDGKILLGGGMGELGQQPRMAIVRLEPDGSLDSTFGTGGLFICDFFGTNDGIRSLAIQPDGKIIGAGHAGDADGFFHFAAVRVTPSGVLDPTFGVGGKFIEDFAGYHDEANGVALQQDGRIVLAGSVWYPGGGLETDFGVIRLNTDGSIDTSFGTGGKSTASFDEHDEGNAVAIQSDGRIVVAGSAGATSIATSNFGLCRLNADGSIDTGFGTGGKTTTDFFSGLDHAKDVLIQADGKIIVGGDINPNIIDIESIVDFGLARYDSSGVLDPTFGNAGKVNTDLGFADAAGGIAITPDCKLVAGGYSWDVTGQSTGTVNFALARYQISGCTVQPPTGGPTCPKTHGYWRNHPDAWPLSTLMLGTQTYSKDELLILLSTTSQTDASITLARQLIAAKLNIANGSEQSPVESAIVASDAVLGQYSGRLPYKVKASSANGQIMTANTVILNSYNQGLLTLSCTP